MQDNRAEKIEALNVAKDYSVRLYKGIGALIDELRGGRLDDTDDYMKTVINGINWVFEVYNATKDLINEQGNVIDRDEINAQSVRLNNAIQEKNDEEAANALEEGIRPFLLDLQKTVEEINLREN